MGKREKKISRFIGRWITEQGAGTVEYVIVVLVAIVIGGGLLTFGNQVSGQVTKTGDSISSWFSKANGTGGTGGGNAGGGGGAADNRIDELKEKDRRLDARRPEGRGRGHREKGQLERALRQGQGSHGYGNDMVDNAHRRQDHDLPHHRHRPRRPRGRHRQGGIDVPNDLDRHPIPHERRRQQRRRLGVVPNSARR